MKLFLIYSPLHFGHFRGSTSYTNFISAATKAIRTGTSLFSHPLYYINYER